jgi:hypothetical protein
MSKATNVQSVQEFLDAQKQHGAILGRRFAYHGINRSEYAPDAWEVAILQAARRFEESKRFDNHREFAKSAIATRRLK